MVLGLSVLGAPMVVMAGPTDSVFQSGGTPVFLAAKDDAAPMSRDALFDLEPEAEKKVESAPGAKEADLPMSDLPMSQDALFDLAPEKETRATPEPVLPSSKEALFADAPSPAPIKKEAQASVWHGFVQAELAGTYANPDHWSKFAGRLELGTRGRLDNGMQWKVSGRIDYNAVYDINDHYSAAVRDDQRAEFHLRENYLDFAAAGWDWRLGRQHIVWGEMVGLFFADVVSAKDLREFVLQDFQLMRIPQWAARAEYFKDDFHAELIWIPFPSYDEVGKVRTVGGQSGSEFYAYPATPVGFFPQVLGETKPANHLSNTNYGLRLSQLTNGWDVSGFLYSSMDSSPTSYVVNRIGPIYQYQLRHDRIHQAGGTLAKDFGGYVLKAEAIYTGGRRYNVRDAADVDGVVKQNTLDWVVGLDFNPGVDTRLNSQFFQRIYFNHNANIVPDHVENGFSLLVNHKLPNNVEAEALFVRSLNRNDWMFRPKLSWGFQRNWRLLFGLDVFGGPADGLFGQYDDKDRVYTEVRYDF
jgi:hypothetical protein